MGRNKTKADDNGREQTPIAEKRRAQIISTAVQLFAERGYFQTTIEDISNAIGIGKGLIYRYFKDKNDVLYCALCAVLDIYRRENVVQMIDSLGPLAALRRILELNCTMAEQHTQEVILAYRSSKDLTPEERLGIKRIESEIVAEIEQCLWACMDAGLMQPLDARIMAYQYIMLGHTWALKRWALHDSYSMAAFLAEGEQLLIRPFLTAAGKRKFAALEASRPARKTAVRTGAR